MKHRSLFVFAAACVALTACQGLKDALTAHVDTAARAGSQELSATRLGDLVGHAKVGVPANRDIVAILADYWVDYQLMAEAAAKGDSLNDKKAIDDATTSFIANAILRKVQDTLQKLLPAAAPTEVGYNQGAAGLYSARHILFAFPGGTPGMPASQAQKDSVRKKAEAILPQVNDKNFAEMAKKYSADGSAAQGGDLGVFPKDKMVAPFANAVASLKPGEISKLVETQFGYHIVQRLSYAQAKAVYDTQFPQLVGAAAGQEYMAKLDTLSKIQLKSNALATTKSVVLAEGQHRNDRTTLATFKGGELTVARLLVWVDGMPAQNHIPQQIQTASDSILTQFLRDLALNEVMLKKADSMKINMTAAEKTGLYHDFDQLVTMVWQALNVDPKSLADSAKSLPEREKLAAARADTFLARVLSGQLPQPVNIPVPLKILIESKYNWKVNSAGLDRAAERARLVRATDDSAKAANAPKSQVPLPGGTPGAGSVPPTGRGAPPPTPPATKKQ